MIDDPIYTRVYTHARTHTHTHTHTHTRMSVYKHVESLNYAAQI